MNTFSRTAVVTMIALGATGLVGCASTATTATASPAPASQVTASAPTSQATTSTPTSQSTPRSGELTATGFSPAFTYVLPTGAKIDDGGTGESHFDFSVPEWGEAGHPGGVLIQAIGDGRADPCDKASAAAKIPAGPQSVIDYVKSVDDLEVSNVTQVSVGPLPAYEATVVAGPATPTCPEIWLWATDTEALSGIPRGVTTRMIAVDVGGEHVLVTVYGEADNLGWKEMVDELVSSIRFAGG